MAAGTTRAAGAAAPPDRGPVDVLYAGSLTNVFEKVIGPAFTRATGYQLVGFGAGSSELANDIKGGVRSGDVFVSASPTVNASLTGRANGGWVTWYATFARSPLVLGYNPHSTFAAQLRHQRWYRVVTEPGFQLGRTDPVLDPKGALTVAAVKATAAAEHDPSLLGVLAGDAGVFPEETLVGRLEAGQLDAAFLYAAEAEAAGIPTVPLSPVHFSAAYTLTVLARAPHTAGADALVRYLLGRRGQAQLAAAGLTVATPVRLHGSPPSALAAALRGG